MGVTSHLLRDKEVLKKEKERVKKETLESIPLFYYSTYFA